MPQQKITRAPNIATNQPASSSNLSSKSNDLTEVGEILNMNNGYGFIKKPPYNLFFSHRAVNGVDFNDLNVGDKVKYKIAKNNEGQDMASDVELNP